MKKTKKRASGGGSRKQEKFQPLSANVKVIGVGGGGGNAVARMAKNFVRGVDFIAINTDHQDLDHCEVKQKLYIGKNLTRGLGTGMNPDLGRQAAEENRSEISEAVQGADLVFLAGGLGGGTATGGLPIVAEAAKQAGALTIAVVTKPFAFEGTQRERIAAEGLMKLKDKVDALIVVPNDRIFTVISKDTPVLKAFEAIDEVLRNALKGLVEIIAMPGIINVDFADVKNIMQDAGVTIIGVGAASGQDRAVAAVNASLHSPLLETSAEGAKAVLLGISGGRDLKMTEINDAAKLVAQTADPGARIIFGAYYDRNLKPNQVKITLVATGFNGSQPNMLFGAGNHYSERQAIFGRPSVINGDMPMPNKKVNVPVVPSEPVNAAGGSSQKGKLSEVDALAFSSTVGKSSLSIDDKKAKAINTNKEKDKDDSWDIPAFLRRRKR
ncbi:MAG: cell division protein FtsZ [Patescibacteria group bacterium]|nr:cell division protein FtsZ [Patescibacteria group bacterium]